MSNINSSTAMNLHEFMEFQAGMSLDEVQLDAGYTNQLADVIADKHNSVNDEVPEDKWCFTLAQWEEADNAVCHGDM